MVNPRRPCVISLAPATSSSSESLVKRYVSSRCLPTLVYGRSNGNWKTLRCATWSRSCTRKSDLLLDERRVDREQYIEDVLAQLRQELQQLISREKSVDGPSTSTALSARCVGSIWSSANSTMEVSKFNWRRRRDSNPRYGLSRTHAFQACTFNHSVTSPN